MGDHKMKFQSPPAPGFKVSTRPFSGVFALLVCPWMNGMQCRTQKGEASDA